MSLTGNYETNLEIHDEAFAVDMERIFDIDGANCRTLTPSEWMDRHVAARVSENTLVPLRPFLCRPDHSPGNPGRA